MNAKGGCIFLLIILSLQSGFAQEFPLADIDPEKLIEEIFPVQNLDLNYDVLYENLLQRLSHPVDLNQVNEDELRSLFILQEMQIQAIVKHRREFGSFLSVYELQSISELDLTTLNTLMPFVKVNDPASTIDATLLERFQHEKNSYFISRIERTLEKKKGYRKETDVDHRYLGSPDKLYFRFRRSRPGDFSVGITAEKDAGEQIKWSPDKKQYGLDSYSFHGQVLNKGRLQNCIVGDYQAQFGQGLLLGGGFGMGKGSETITTIRRANLGFLPYTAVQESGYFRGAAVSYGLSKKISWHGFASGMWRDAELLADSLTDDASQVSSMATTGYHRTPEEVASRKQIHENNFGTVFDFKCPSLQAGVITHTTRFSHPFVRKPTLYNRFYFNGDHNTNSSAYLNYAKNNFCFFSELAQTWGHGHAIVAGVLSSFTRALEISLLFRSYSRDFYSFYGNALSENTNTQNETGFYWGIKYTFSKRCSFSAYLDLFQFQWLRYRGYDPSSGSEWLMRLNYQPAKTISLYGQAREESKNRNLSDSGNLFNTGDGIKRNYWINCDVTPKKGVSMKTRLQLSTYRLNGHTSRGWVLLQDLYLTAGRFGISGRYALFDTDDYDNRLYVYERDVLLAFSFPAYYGVGVRQFLMFHYRLNRSCDLWIRWAHTRYIDRSQIGSAGETVIGNVQNDVKLQVRIWF